MNANNLGKLKEWREGDYYDGLSLADIKTNMCLALHDFLSILGVGNADIAEVMGEENMAYIKEFLAERPHPAMLDEGVKAYRSAKTLFEPEKGLEEYGLMPTPLHFSDVVWDALEETEDDHFVIRGPLVFDQNTRTVWLWGGIELEALTGPMMLEADQIAFAASAMKGAGGGLSGASFP